MTDWTGPTLRLLAQSQVISTRIYWLLGAVLGLLVLAYVIGRLLKRYPDSGLNPALVERFNHRIRVWWLMCAILVAGFMLGRAPTFILFGLVSFWALREFITMTPTRRSDHRTLFWVFFVFTPAQYVMVGLGQRIDLYGLYSIAIPVYAFLYITARIAISGDHKRFLERSAKIHAGLFICVYCLSYAPALLNLGLVTSKGEPWGDHSSLDISVDGNAVSVHELAHLASDKLPPDILPNAGLLFYFFLIVQLEDVLQGVWSRLAGRRLIAPAISASRTWEGFMGGVASATLIGALLWWATPFRPWEAACMSMIIAVAGFVGSMVMSAIKRDRGVADYGTLVQGHAGVLDRIDSVCFAAPVFFHLTRYFFSTIS